AVEERRDSPLFTSVWHRVSKIPNEILGYSLLATGTIHFRGAEPTKVIGERQIKQEAAVYMRRGADDMQFSCAKGDSACKAIRESSLSVFKARSNLRDDDISIAEIRVAFGATYERLRRLKVDS